MKSRGMSLIEVLIALAIFSASGLAILNVTSQQIQIAGYLERKTLATWIADSTLQELRLNRVKPELNWNKKQMTFAGQTWYVRWRGAEIGATQMRKLEVEVHTSEAYSAAVATQSTLIRL